MTSVTKDVALWLTQASQKLIMLCSYRAFEIVTLQRKRLLLNFLHINKSIMSLSLEENSPKLSTVNPSVDSQIIKNSQLVRGPGSAHHTGDPRPPHFAL